MSTRLKHTDDDGDLSVFVSGNQVLFACNNGHAWTARLAVEPDVCPAARLEIAEVGMDITSGAA
jgi:hypothetical protein